MLYRTELRRLSMPEGFEPTTFGFDVLQTGSRSLFSGPRRRSYGQTHCSIQLSYTHQIFKRG